MVYSVRDALVLEGDESGSLGHIVRVHESNQCREMTYLESATLVLTIFSDNNVHFVDNISLFRTDFVLACVRLQCTFQ
jgi:hypothetical protein